MYHCRELAMARMESEADALGADGVIGVRIRPLNYAFASDVLEFVAVGTALTMVIQSSSASIALTMVLCENGTIGYDMAAALVLGENIGTAARANICFDSRIV
jgi:Na+/phosphate symporter